MKYIAYRSPSAAGPLQKLAGAVVAVAIAGALLVFSSIFLAALALLAVIGGAVVWWKTRHLRKIVREMRASMKRARGEYDGAYGQGPFGPAGPSAQSSAQYAKAQYAQDRYTSEERYEGAIIEGEAVRVDEPRQQR